MSSPNESEIYGTFAEVVPEGFLRVETGNELKYHAISGFACKHCLGPLYELYENWNLDKIDGCFCEDCPGGGNPDCEFQPAPGATQITIKDAPEGVLHVATEKGRPHEVERHR